MTISKRDFLKGATAAVASGGALAVDEKLDTERRSPFAEGRAPESPAVIERILEHLGRDAGSVDPAHPSRAPPEPDTLL